MSNISIYKDKINGVGGLIDSIVKSSNKLDTQLGTLRNTLQGVDSSTCNLQGVVSSISSSSKSEKEKVADLKRLNSKLTDFITMTAKRDASAKSAVERAKNDFYSKYSYLKPECEKGALEHIRDGIISAAEWCKKHWKLIVVAIIVVVSIVVLCIPGVGPIIAGACWGALLGACLGGVSGGLESMANGGSFLDGFEDGALTGAITGAISGAAMAGLGVLGGSLGKFVQCGSTLGKFVKGTAAVTKVLSAGMGAFDMLAMADRYLGNGDIAALNAKLHESQAYNIFQTGVSAVAVFTGGMTTTMKCFVAGTMILTAEGLVAIENIKAGDKVLSRNPETGEISYKTVAVSFVNQANKLAHVTVNGETIVSTHDHPYYVKNRGFVNACELWIGAELIDRKGVVHPVEQIYCENLGENYINVYNFKVEDDHTYYVGEIGILVHNSCGHPHHMEGEVVRDGKSVDKFHGEYTSGAEPGCGRLNYQEQLSTHTESKFLDNLEGKVKPGDHLEMHGSKNPCRPGCQPKIRKFVARNDVTASYSASDTGLQYNWEPTGNGAVKQTVIDTNTNTTISTHEYYKGSTGKWTRKPVN